MEKLRKTEYSTVSVNKVFYSLDNNSDDVCASNSSKDLQRVVCTDEVIVEQPLQITLAWLENKVVKRKVFSITMRTPGQDKLLILGLLYSEGIISSVEVIKTIASEAKDADNYHQQNEWLIQFNPDFIPDLASLERFQMTYSSCGLCGSTSLKALELKTKINLSIAYHQGALASNELLLLSDKLRDSQAMFAITGGVHGVALFDSSLNIKHIYEDIGRHNAVDKVIGALLLSERLGDEVLIDKTEFPLYLLLVSGRISFEIVQKAIMAGISVLAGVGAPSQLAIQAAKRFDLTIIGFISKKGFNVYHGDWRINNDSSTDNHKP